MEKERYTIRRKRPNLPDMIYTDTFQSDIPLKMDDTHVALPREWFENGRAQNYIFREMVGYDMPCDLSNWSSDRPYTDNAGGYHAKDSNINPNGVFCGSCGRITCVGCGREKITYDDEQIDGGIIRRR